MLLDPEKFCTRSYETVATALAWDEQWQTELYFLQLCINKLFLFYL